MRKQIENLNLESFPKGSVTRVWLKISENGLNEDIRIPVIIAKGEREGKAMGITAALHGNELNGIPVIQQIIDSLPLKRLKGTVIAVPVMNVSGYLGHFRKFNDHVDLNHIMPGKKNGNASEVYAYRLFHKIVKNIDYLIDLHTASFGRQNTLYIRSDMNDKIANLMARLIEPEILLHNPPNDRTLRGSASKIGIPSITVEIGNPHRFQEKYIKRTVAGIKKILSELSFLSKTKVIKKYQTIECTKSQWIYTSHGGVLKVIPELGELVKKGDVLAEIFNIFGELISVYKSPKDGIIIGKSVDPVAETGARIVHLGVLK